MKIQNLTMLAATMLLLGTDATFAQTTNATGSGSATVQTMPGGPKASSGAETNATVDGSNAMSHGVATGTGQSGGNTTATGGTPGGNPTRN